MFQKQLIFSVDDLKEQGFSYYQINRLVQNKILKKLNKKYYESLVYDGNLLDVYYQKAFSPKSVVCLMSAATYYGLTTFRTESLDIAIHRKNRVSTILEWPAVSLYYFSDIRYILGLIEIKEGMNVFHIYDLEKTVVDIISFRDKIGVEETKEVLINYLQRKDRNLNQLMRYAKLLNCHDIIETYMEVLI